MADVINFIKEKTVDEFTREDYEEIQEQSSEYWLKIMKYANNKLGAEKASVVPFHFFLQSIYALKSMGWKDRELMMDLIDHCDNFDDSLCDDCKNELDDE